MKPAINVTKKVYLPIFLLMIFVFVSVLVYTNNKTSLPKDSSWWSVQSIDTVKYSRDLAREKSEDSTFNDVINKQVSLIASTGATHIALGTPYDEEFVPFLTRWVTVARRQGLKVWFRGNMSGWEQWFNYPTLTRSEHVAQIEKFILKNPDLFEDGDIFTSCSECENGGGGDPRQTKDIVGYRKFLIEEYGIARGAFGKIGKNVRANFYSMNGDVAKLIMDKETTKALGEIVVIDHYVGTSDQLLNDIEAIAKSSGGKIVLGEIGVPIPDIHGNLNENEQAAWLDDALWKISKSGDLVGINYWTGFGGSTQIWDGSYNMLKVGGVLKEYYNPKSFNGIIKNEIGIPIGNVNLSTQERDTLSNSKGQFTLPYLEQDLKVKINAVGYKEKIYLAEERDNLTIYLEKEYEGPLYFILKNIYRGIQSILLGNS